jgi:uncharacterized YigZ family protein
MKTLNKIIQADITVTKSKFISTIFPISNKEEATKFLEETRKKYFDARHNCYAYIIYDPKESTPIIKKSSDDGEPSGTAGAPILECLEGAGLVNVLCVVTRYFGGVLLGTGGLTRAYSSSCKESINKANEEKIIKELYEGYEVNIEIKYDLFSMVKKSLETKKYKELQTTYEQNIKMKFIISKEDYEKTREEFATISFGSINLKHNNEVKLFTKNE